MKGIYFSNNALRRIIYAGKRQTLRLNENDDIETGDIVKLMLSENKRSGAIEITSKDTVTYKDLSEDDAKRHGVKSLSVLKSKLLSIYPEINENSKLIRLKFELVETSIPSNKK